MWPRLIKSRDCRERGKEGREGGREKEREKEKGKKRNAYTWKTKFFCRARKVSRLHRCVSTGYRQKDIGPRHSVLNEWRLCTRACIESIECAWHTIEERFCPQGRPLKQERRKQGGSGSLRRGVASLKPENRISIDVYLLSFSLCLSVLPL